MPFAQPLLVGPQNQWDMRKHRRRGAERLEQQQMLRRVGDVVIAADDMRNPHIEVINDD